MSFFDDFTVGGGIMGQSRGGINVGDVFGSIGSMYGLGSVWTGLGCGLPMVLNGYRPRTWNIGMNAVQMVMVRSNIGGLFFDAIIHTDTQEHLTITSHPVQAGANISDHAFREPTRITMEIMMSDAMAERLPGQFSGIWDKSVSAYRRLVELQRSRIPFSVMTRLNMYQNMLIENISAPDDVGTQNGLRCTVELREVLLAQVTTTKVSARKWTTGTGTQNSEVQPVEKPSTGIAIITGRGTGGSQGVRT